MIKLERWPLKDWEFSINISISSDSYISIALFKQYFLILYRKKERKE